MSETEERLVNAIDALSASVAGRESRIATLEALLAERPAPADPALLALAKFGALMCRDADWPRSQDDPDQSPGYIDLSAYELRRVMDDAGLLLGRDGTPEPGVRPAVAALLAPDGAESEVHP